MDKLDLSMGEAKASVIPIDKAIKEVDAWLNFKRFPEGRKEANKDQIESISGAISDGYLQITSENKLIHTLLVPIENAKGDETVTELTYKARLNSLQIDPWLKGVKSDDGLGLVTGHICALTSQNRNIIKSLDTTDLSLARAIATFFL